jgi:hypothetical protein
LQETFCLTGSLENAPGQFQRVAGMERLNGKSSALRFVQIVMPGLDPGIHEMMDCRVKPGNDDAEIGLKREPL